MKIKDLLSTVTAKGFAGNLNEEASGLSFDSRSTNPGDIFFALQGTKVDGHRYIPDLLARGVRFFVTEKNVPELQIRSDVVWLRVLDVRLALAQAAHVFYRRASDSLLMVGVTGTNGKTTSAYWLEDVLSVLGLSVGVSGTIHTRFKQKDGTTVDEPSVLTTPDACTFQATLRRMVDAGVEVFVGEISSHALAMKRVDAVAFDFGLFTNLTRDHLDFHKDLEDYFGHKSRLFLDLIARTSKTLPKPLSAKAAINIDDVFGRRLFATIREKKMYPAYSFSIRNKDAHFFVESSVQSAEGTEASIQTPKGRVAIKTALIGEHNLYNLLGVLAFGFSMGFSLDTLATALGRLTSVPGRLEPVPSPTGQYIFVDYAHTPDALENVLKALAPLKEKTARLFCLFGCGGDRDAGKRPLMAQIAARLSDFVWVTSDNPRTEDPDKIISQILAGFPTAFTRFSMETDRRKAIVEAVGQMRKGDILLIAGKGHEDYQIIGQEKHPFSDVAEAKKALLMVEKRLTPKP